MQLSSIDFQIEKIKDLLAKYTYTIQEKEIKVSFLRGYITACMEAQIISQTEYKAYSIEINSL